MKMQDVDIYWSASEVRVVRREFVDRRRSDEMIKAERDLDYVLGACCAWWPSAGVEHLLYLFVDIVGHGVDVHAAHKEFMKIDEYRKWWRTAGGMMKSPSYRLATMIG